MHILESCSRVQHCGMAGYPNDTSMISILVELPVHAMLVETSNYDIAGIQYILY